MRIAATSFLLLLLIGSVLCQEAKPPILGFKKTRELTVSRPISVQVPERIRDFHASGTLVAMVDVDQTGSVEKVIQISGFKEHQFLWDFVKESIAAWSFKPYKIEGKATRFRGIVLIPFCYGGFPEKGPC